MSRFFGCLLASIFGGSVERAVEASREFNAANTLSFFFGGNLGPILHNLAFGKKESLPAIRGWLDMDLTGADRYAGATDLLDSQGGKRVTYENLGYAEVMARANKGKDDLWEAADGLFDILKEMADGLLKSTKSMARPTSPSEGRQKAGFSPAFLLALTG